MGYRVVEVLDGPLDVRKWFRVKETGHLFIAYWVRNSALFKERKVVFDIKGNKVYSDRDVENVQVEEIEEDYEI